MKTILTFDMKRYDHQKYDEYVETVQKIFKHRNVRLVDQKIDLINQICQELPIVLIGNARDVKIRSIINVINQLLFLQNGEENSLAYKTKKVRTVKDGKEYYTTMYKFYFFVTTGDKK